MTDYLAKFRERTRWNPIPGTDHDFRLLCSNQVCSLSCANIRDGNLAVTSVHGSERHSQVLSKNDMAFLAILFLDTLSEKELNSFCNVFNKISPDFVLKLEKI